MEKFDYMLAYIRAELTEGELLAQLAEESAELTHAALKLRRVIDGTNHTPVSFDEAYRNLEEEIADVMLCLQVLGITAEPKTYQEQMDAKLERWAIRLREARKEGSEDGK